MYNVVEENVNLFSNYKSSMDHLPKKMGLIMYKGDVQSGLVELHVEHIDLHFF